MRTIKKNLFVLICLLTLSSCGGGGGGGNSGNGGAGTATASSLSNIEPVTPSSNTTDYFPDAALLGSDAKDSNEIYVKPGFTFSTTQTINLLVSTHSALGEIAANTRVRVYALTGNDESLLSDGLTEDSLVFTGFTNSLGRLEDTLEASSAITYFAVTADLFGKQNQIILTANNNYLSYDF